MAGDFKSQLEHSETASAAEADGHGRGPRGAYRRATQPIRDGLAEVAKIYEAAPPATKAAVIMALILLAAFLPQMLPYITAQPEYWTFVLTKVGIAALLALGLNVVVGFA